MTMLPANWLAALLSVKVPEPILFRVPLLLFSRPKTDAKVTLFAPVSRVAVAPVLMINREERSVVVAAPHWRVELPAKVILPVPKPVLVKLAVPEVIVTPPVKVLAPERVVTPEPLLLMLRATLPPPAPLPMMPLSVMPPVLDAPMLMVWVPEVAAPVTAPMVSNPPAEFEKFRAVISDFSVSAVLMVLAPLDCWKMPEDAPVPPIVIAPPVRVVVGPTFAAKVMLLALCVPETVMLPVLVVACLMMRSSPDVVVLIVEPAPPVSSVFQNKLLPFQAPTTELKPAVVPFTSQ